MNARPRPQRFDAVYFFGTCLMDAVYPNAGMAAIRMLESLGVKVVFPQGRSCFDWRFHQELGSLRTRSTNESKPRTLNL